MGPLVDLIPANARKYVYAVLSAGVFVYGLWEASQGDWTQFVVATVTSLVALMATANTDTPTEVEVIVLEPVEEDVEFDNSDSPQFDKEVQ